MKSSKSTTTIGPAFLKAQIAIESAVKGKVNEFFDSKYADLASVIQAVKGPLNDNGIFFTQPVYQDEQGVYVQTVLQHAESGERFWSETPVMVAKPNNPQAMVSGVTYAKRCGLSAITGLPTADDDGNAATRPPKQPQQAPQKPKPPITADAMKTDKHRAWIQTHETAEAAIAALQTKYTLDAKAIQHVKDEFAKKGK